MNSLEFINEEINYLNELLLYHQKEYDKLQYDKGSIMQTFHLDQIERINDNLMMMKQIKTELEAWEVVKEKFFIDIIERDNIIKLVLNLKHQ